MRRLASRSGLSTQSDDRNILPLINVVFLLLMFFMMAGQFTSPGYIQDLPESLSESPLRHHDIRIDIPLVGRIHVDGDPVDGDPVDGDRMDGDPIDTSLLETLRTRIDNLQATNAVEGRPGDPFPDGQRDAVILLVHIDRSLDVGALDPVLTALRELPPVQLQIATLSRQ